VALLVFVVAVASHDLDYDEFVEALGERPALDPFLDDEPLECGLESPETCESCQ